VLLDLVENRINVFIIRLIDLTEIAVDKWKFAVGIGMPSVVPQSNDALNDIETFGLAIIEIGIHIGGSGVIEDAPSRIRLPEKWSGVGPDEITAIVRNADSLQWFSGRAANQGGEQKENMDE